MTKTGKLLVALVLCLSLFVGTGAAAGLNAVISNFKLFVNGERVDQAVVVIDGRSYLPVRAIGEALGAQVDFNAETGRIDVNTEAGKPETPPVPPTTKSYKPGMYKVGTDMPAGEYLLTSNTSAYFDISKDSTGNLASIIANGIFTNRSIVTVSAGQYLTLRDCEAYLFASAPAAKPANGYLPEGMYKVGVDLPAGEYKVIPDGSGYLEVSSDSTHSLLSIVTNDIFEDERYITVKDGQYLTLRSAKLRVE